MPVTESEYNLLNSFIKVNFGSNDWDMKFINSLYGVAVNGGRITDKQRYWLFRTLYKYRRQLRSFYEKFKHLPECSKNGDGKKEVEVSVMNIKILSN